jgi:hypothetical protein
VHDPAEGILLLFLAAAVGRTRRVAAPTIPIDRTAADKLQQQQLHNKQANSRGTTTTTTATATATVRDSIHIGFL